MRGLTFTIPNEYGQFVAEILSVVPISDFVWRTGGEEAYYIENNELGRSLFPTEQVMSGKELQQKITLDDYYTIFVDLKAFPSAAAVSEVLTYEDFLRSACTFVLLIVDCSYVTIYAKSAELLNRLYEHTNRCGYDDVEKIYDETDARTSLVVF